MGSALLFVGAPGLADEVDPCAGLRFEDVATGAGLSFVHATGATGSYHLPETMGAGAAWLDYDGDGILDLYVVQSGAFPPDRGADSANRLFRGLGNGRFEDASAASGAADRGYGQGVLAADLDGNGHTDLYVTNYGPDVLLRNRGDGTFEDRTEAAGLGLDGWSSSAAAADADGDGDLDLYVTRYVAYDEAEPIFCGDVDAGQREYCVPTLFLGATDRFYRNRGDGTFEDATVEAGVAPADGRGLGVLFTDLDGDTLPDVYVANDLSINLLYRNRGDGTFEPLSLVSGAGVNARGDAEAGMGVAAGDVDGDGDPDLAVTNFDVETNTLYRNLGGMRFEDVSAETGFGVPSFNLLGFGIVLADLDLDGDLDGYVANGHIHENPKREGVSHAQRDLLLLGDGSGRFRPAVCGPALEEARVGRGLAPADYDDDGDVDLLIVDSGGPLQLLRNDAPGTGRFVGVSLDGRRPNTHGVGSRVVLETRRGRQVRWAAAGTSYQSTGDSRILFGLAGDDAALRIEVTWPSGETTVLADPAVDRYHTIRQEGALAGGAGTGGRHREGGRFPLWLIATVAVGGAIAAFLALRFVLGRR
jgi:hypothetical protein